MGCVRIYEWCLNGWFSLLGQVCALSLWHYEAQVFWLPGLLVCQHREGDIP